MDITQAIVRILSADAELMALAPGGVWEAIPGRDARPPYVIVTFAAGSTETSHDLSEIESGTVDAKVITQGEKFSSAEVIRARIRIVLKAVNTSEDYGIKTLLRSGAIRYVEHDGDHRYNHLGDQYRYTHWGLTEE
jgi:hypothetical protein